MMNTGGMDQFVDQANRLGAARKPFLFIIDFEKQKPLIRPLPACREEGIYYHIEGLSNVEPDARPIPDFGFHRQPVAFDRYEAAFRQVTDAIHYGDSYLVNLCFPTEIETSLGLEEIFKFSRARYKLLVDGLFIVFSPESFIRIRDGRISTFPMKGTIDAAIPGAREKILADEKEMAEHATIVDLLRNDLNMVARNVRVDNYRYVEEVQSWKGKLLQVSSQISGVLPADFRGHLGTILDLLTPAGSVSGAPKKRTLELIREAEQEKRGYFAGVFGMFDGDGLNSGVMIRYLEQTPRGFRYWSGGGVTSNSSPQAEYEELIQKVYVPIY
jgi:para-aminobenzoate synthetase component 1